MPRITDRVLQRRIDMLVDANEELSAMNRAMRKTLSHVRRECNRLLEENRQLKSCLEQHEHAELRS